MTEPARHQPTRAAQSAVPVRPTGLEPFWPSRRAPAYSELCR